MAEDALKITIENLAERLGRIEEKIDLIMTDAHANRNDIMDISSTVNEIFDILQHRNDGLDPSDDVIDQSSLDQSD